MNLTLTKFLLVVLLFAALTCNYSCKDKEPDKSGVMADEFHSDAYQDTETAKAVLTIEDDAKTELLNKIDKSSGNVAAQILLFRASAFPEGKTFHFKNVNFPTGSADISDDLLNETEELALLLKVFPDVKIKIESHTDNLGDETLNQMLSDLRASNIKDLLTDQFGILSERIEISGLGQTQPLTDHNTDEGKLKNRRILLYLMK